MKILKNIDLSQLTSFSMGGKAKYLVQIEKEEEIKDLYNFAKEKKMNYFILGNGTNTIFDDEGYNGIIAKILINDINFLDHYTIEVSAGADLSKFIYSCIENKLKGYEKMFGIPGTIGGAIRGNSGSKGQEIKDNLISVKFYHEKELKTYYNEECEFFYRKSIFKKLKNVIILSAKFQLEPGNKKKLSKIARDISKDRSKRLPLDLPSAGCFFKNPIIHKDLLPNNIPKNVVWNYNNENLKISAAWLIENVGLKGYKLNEVGVSNKHSLFLVNFGNAKFSDLVNLSNLIKNKVYNKFSIQLEPEVELVY